MPILSKPIYLRRALGAALLFSTEIRCRTLALRNLQKYLLSCLSNSLNISHFQLQKLTLLFFRSLQTNVGSLYIAPLAAPVEPQAQNIVRQQMMQQQRNSPMRQMSPAPSQQANRATPARWMNSQAPTKEQPEWARSGDYDGNVIPSQLNRMKSPPPPQVAAPQMPMQGPQAQPQYRPMQQTAAMPTSNGNAYGPGMNMNGQNFGASMHAAPTGLRLQINTSTANNSSSNGPRVAIAFMH